MDIKTRRSLIAGCSAMAALFAATVSIGTAGPDDPLAEWPFTVVVPQLPGVYNRFP
jgi:hypothetical protein